MHTQIAQEKGLKELQSRGSATMLPRYGLEPNLKVARCITSLGCSRAGLGNVMLALQDSLPPLQLGRSKSCPAAHERLRLGLPFKMPLYMHFNYFTAMGTIPHTCYCLRRQS